MVALSPDSTYQSIPTAIRVEICRRAAQLSDAAKVSWTILSTMREAEIDFAEVTLEEMKVVLIQALRAFRRRQGRGMRGSAA